MERLTKRELNEHIDSFSVKLQKILLCLILLNLLSLFFFNTNYLHNILYSLLLLIGICAAKRRSVCGLNFYWVFQMILLILNLVLVIYLAVVTHSITSSTQTTTTEPKLTKLIPAEKTITHHKPANITVEVNKESTSSSSQVHIPNIAFVGFSIATLLYFIFLLFLKIKSMVLARKMAVMLRELASLDDDEDVEDVKQDNTDKKENNGIMSPPLYVSHPEQDKNLGAQLSSPFYYVQPQFQQQQQQQPQQQRPIFVVLQPTPQQQQGSK